ncbi:MAG: outer membrane beta-barrel protein [Draconibacterium sp.]|nr:outer membrane beta-barrel protein [Draconibacterium sp.]
MKKIYFSILLIFLVSIVFGQKQKVKYLTTFDDKLLHFGFTLGINGLDFRVHNYNPIGDYPDFKEPLNPEPGEVITAFSYIRSDLTEIIPGFTVGIVTSLRLTKDLNLRFLPGMSFGERKLVFNVPVIDINQSESLPYYSIKSTFLDFPLLFKYKARRINNGRPYIVFGPAFRQDISRTAQEDLIKLKNGSFYAEIGAGWDNYFPFFKFSLEAKFSFGLTNQLGNLPSVTQRQYYAQSIKNLRSNLFTLSFHFE